MGVGLADLPASRDVTGGARCERRSIRGREHVKGAVDKAKGAMKDAAGKLVDDKKLRAEGKLDKAKGAAHEAPGDAKDAAKRAEKEFDRN